MKPGIRLTLFFPFFCLIACGGKKPAQNPGTAIGKSALQDTPVIRDHFPVAKLVPMVYCRDDASQSYALYIPETKTSKLLPVVYFFDPHGQGSLPLDKYKSLADKYQFILVGSNNSKNGNDWSFTEKIWRNLFGDTKSRLPIDIHSVYACGFSGGAKVASYLALNYPEIRGVVAGGAGLPDGIAAADFGFSFTGIAGTGDLNMTDLVTLNSDFDKTRTRHRIIFFNGKHEWSPVETMDQAFAGLQLDALRESGALPVDEGFIKMVASEYKNRVTASLNAGNQIVAEQDCALAENLLEGLSGDVAWFQREDASLLRNPGYQKQFKAQQALFTREAATKEFYQQQFQQGSPEYWKKTIAELERGSRTLGPEAAMNQRLLAYLSLAFYSLSNQFIQSNQQAAAVYFDGLYKIADPENPEAWYFSAILDARADNSPSTEADLLKAVEKGFSDSTRLVTQPEFHQLTNPINLKNITERFRNNFGK